MQTVKLLLNELQGLEAQAFQSINLLKLVCFIQLLQFLALLFPKDNWNNITTYDEYNFKILITLTKITILNFEKYYYEIFICLACFTMLSLLIYLSTLIQFARSPNTIQLVGFYLTLLPLIFLVPQAQVVFAYIMQFGENTIEYGISIFVSTMILGIILISNWIQGYFIRAIEIQQSNIFNRKLTSSHFIYQILQIISIYLYTYQTNDFTQYVKLFFYFLQCLAELYDHLFNFPFTQNGQIFLSCCLIKLSSLFIVFLVVITENSLFKNSLQFLIIVIAGCFSYAIGILISQRQKGDIIFHTIKDLESLKFTIRLISFLEKKQKNTPRSSESIELKCLLNFHFKNCKQCQLDLKNFQQFTTKQIIYCLLNRQQKFSQNEDLYLLYVDFLNVYCQQPMLSYMKLRSFEVKSSNLSLFYKVHSQYIYSKLQMQIQTIQNVTKFSNDSAENDLVIDSILIFYQLEQNYLQYLIAILNKKVEIWEQQIEGFKSIYELKEKIIEMTKNMMKLHEQLQRTLKFNLSDLHSLSSIRNPLLLKFLSLYYSAVLNDIQNAYFCETQIITLLNQESAAPSDTLTYTAQFNERLFQMSVSLVKNLGNILNQDKTQIGKAFGYDEKDEQNALQNINQLMPFFIGCVHNKILSHFLSTGKSNFFVQFRQTFGLNQSGFIFPLYLKFNNDFSVKDDYIIQTTMFLSDRNNDFILFNEQGKIVGMTKQIFIDLIKEFDQTISVAEIVENYFIYQFFPNIVKVLGKYQELVKKDYGQSNVEDESQFVARNNVKEFAAAFGKAKIQNYINTLQYIQEISQEVNSESKSVIQKNQINLSRNLMTVVSLRSTNTKKQFTSCDLLNNEMDDDIHTIYSEFHSKEVTIFNLRFYLIYWQFGSGDHKKTLFIMEVLDYRKQDLGSFSTGVYQSKNSSAQYSTQIQKSQNYHNKVSIHTDYQTFVEDHPKFPSDKLNATNIINQFQKLDDFNLNSDQFIIESFRNSARFGPISKRALFNEVKLREVDDEIVGEPEEYFEWQQIQILSARNMEKNNILNDEDNNIEEKSDSQKIKNSLSKSKQSNKLSLKIKNYKYMKANDMDIMKSQSSQSSRTSGQNLNGFVKSFQFSKEFPKNIFLIGSINLIILITLIVLIIINIFQLENQNDLTIRDGSLIAGPLKFNRYCNQLMSLTYILSLQALSIFNCSDYLISQNIQEIQKLSLTMVSELHSLYPIFINIEEQGLLDKQYYESIRYPTNTNLTYTDYVYILSIQYGTLIQAKSLVKKQLPYLQTTKYLDSVINLRLNIIPLYNINAQLINSLTTIFKQDIDNFQAQLILQILFEIIGIGIILWSQLIYWQKIEKIDQTILLLMCKMTENDAIDLIYKSKYIKQGLTIFSGDQNWIKQDYYHIIYSNETKKQQSVKSLKIQKGKHIQSSLSSRINNNRINLCPHITIIFVTFLIICLYLTSVYLIHQKQTEDVFPQQNLSMVFVSFSSQIDVVVTSSLILKTDSHFYGNLIAKKLYTSSELVKPMNRTELLDLFQTLVGTYASKIMTIFEGIVLSNNIKTSDSNKLYNLYYGDFCLTISDSVPFCNLAELGEQKFIENYGAYYQEDDDTEYLNNGIIGIVSRLQSLIKSNFDSELSVNQETTTSEIEYEQLIESKEFNNALLSHFIDAYEGIQLFLDTLNSSTAAIMQNNLQIIELYTILVGAVIIAVYFCFYVMWLCRRRESIKSMRLSLVLLPIEILTNPQNMSLLRKINY